MMHHTLQLYRRLLILATNNHSMLRAYVRVMRKLSNNEDIQTIIDTLICADTTDALCELIVMIAHGLALDTFAHASDYQLRTLVALTTTSSNTIYATLANDPCPLVRCALAEQGHMLDKLSNDVDWRVRRSVKVYLGQAHELTLSNARS